MALDRFELTAAIHREIVQHAREGKPREVCGVLRGRGTHAFQLKRGRNIAPDPIKDYVVDTQTLLLQIGFEEEGDEMVAIYHSHPVSPAYPSASDAWNAHYPDCAYIICSLENDQAPVVRAFRLIGHNVTFDLAKLSSTLKFAESRPGLFAHFQAEDSDCPAVLADVCEQVSGSFYVIFESPGEQGKNPISRAVSVTEYQIQF